MKNLFEKFMNTSDEANWAITDGGLPNRLKSETTEVSNANNALESGFYWANPATATNLPAALPTVNDNAAPLMVVRVDENNLLQVLYSRNGDGKLWVRTRLTGVWTTWILASGNITADLATKVSKSGDNMSGPLNMGGFEIGQVGQFNMTGALPWNYVINGNFDLWDYAGLNPPLWNSDGTDESRTRVGPNRYNLYWEGNLGTIFNAYRAFPGAASGIAGRPTNSFNIQTAGTTGTDTFIYWSQVIEELREFSGKQITITLWMLSTNPAPVTIVTSAFGVTGLASDVFDKRQVNLTAQWQKISFVVNIPSLTGATLATYHGLLIRVYPVLGLLEAADLGVAAHNVGITSTFAFARFSVNKGDWTKADDPFRDKPLQLERMLSCRHEYLIRSAGAVTLGPGVCRTLNQLDMNIFLPARTFKIPTLIHSELADFTLSPGGSSPTAIVVTGAGYYTDTIDQITVRFTFASLALNTVTMIAMNNGAYLGFINPEYK